MLKFNCPGCGQHDVCPVCGEYNASFMLETGDIQIASFTNDFKKENIVIEGECEDITNKRALAELEDK